MKQASALSIRGFKIYSGYLSRSEQESLVAKIREVAQAAPFRQPVTPGGQKMSVRMTSAGPLGWITDRHGYRYQGHQPDGAPWPKIPDHLLKIWRGVGSLERDPDCCLVNYYDTQARMGLHQDKDEGSFDWPVVSISLGDDALFRMGGTNRSDKTESMWLNSGDVVVMGGAARLAYHGVDRIRAGSTLLKNGGRLNLTLHAVRQSS